MTPDEFWELSWYDWTLYLHKLERIEEERKAREENEWDRTRTLMAFIANQNPYRQKGSAPAKPTDFIKLSWDKDVIEKVSTPLTPEEVQRRFGKLTEPINYGE